MTNKILAEMTVGEVVAQNFQTADVFVEFGIDFCCGGKKTLGKACQENQIQIETLVRKLEDASNTESNIEIDPSTLSLDALADYIEEKHHRYVREQIPILTAYTEKIADVHAERHPELLILEKQFALLANDLLEHLQKEERILFPYVRQLVKKAPTMLSSAQAPIHVMEHEHEYAGALLSNIRSITNNYAIPDDACTKYRITFSKLQEFEQDLHQHIHLENNILFPRVLKEENAQN